MGGYSPPGSAAHEEQIKVNQKKNHNIKSAVAIISNRTGQYSMNLQLGNWKLTYRKLQVDVFVKRTFQLKTNQADFFIASTVLILFSVSVIMMLFNLLNSMLLFYT